REPVEATAWSSWAPATTPFPHTPARSWPGFWRDRASLRRVAPSARPPRAGCSSETRIEGEIAVQQGLPNVELVPGRILSQVVHTARKSQPTYSAMDLAWRNSPR